MTKVLIADDEPVSQRLLEATLQRWGYHVITASDGREAWDALCGEPVVDIAVLDWMMPHINGPELCRRLRADPPQHYTYLILLTARSTTRDTIEGLDAGADDYIIKPPDPMVLRSRLRVGERVIRLQRRLEDANRKLVQLAVTDELTGLLNRRSIVARLQDELQRTRRLGHPLSVAMADLDRFKVVNDRHGHHAGDAVLALFACILRDSCRAYDQIGRYGGEEFLLIFPESGVDDAYAGAERLRQRMGQATLPLHTGEVLQVTVSIGVVQASGDPGESVDHLVARADNALYRAKGEGRDCVCAEPVLVDLM